MSWMWRQLYLQRLPTEPNVQMPVQSSKLREAIGLQWNLRPGDVWMSSEVLGRRIDHCLVEFTSLYLEYLEAEADSVEKFNSDMLQVRHRMREDRALMDFAETLLRRKQPLPLASEVYIKLACQRVLSDRRQPPSFERGRRFARVMLDRIREEDSWQIDWDREPAIKDLKNAFLEIRNPQERQNLIDESERTPLVWDTLQRLCEDFGDTGKIPPIVELERWAFQSTYGHLKRPSEGQPIPNRPRVLGYMLRNNEIRHTVDLLRQVGMPKTAAYKAVGKALDLSGRTIERIYGKPYWAVKELKDHMIMRLDSLPPPRA